VAELASPPGYEGPIVQMRGVRKAFNIGTPIETEVLHGVDLTLERGEFCAVMGPSGSGKSTLLNIVGLLDRPSGGRMSICGEETTQLEDAALSHLRAHRIGFVFQYHYLISAFTALENVLMPMLGQAGFANRAMVGRASELLDKVGLAHRRDNLATHLSGGEQQRVAVARAMAMNPALLLADEPTGNLDTKSAQKVFDLMRALTRDSKTAILFVTHNAALAQRCDRIIDIVDGTIAPARSIESARSAA
jgi:lipoprotein-releasing system ATP-binding protein